MNKPFHGEKRKLCESSQKVLQKNRLAKKDRPYIERVSELIRNYVEKGSQEIRYISNLKYYILANN